MDSYPLAESFDAIGEWFLPSDPDRKIVGSLSYSSDRTQLDLNEAFQPLLGAVYVADTQGYPLVHGVTNGGRQMSLIGAQRLGMSFHGAQQSERLITMLLIVGAHIPEGCVFSGLDCRIPGLHIWLSRQVISHDLTPNDATRTFSVHFQVEPPPEETTRIPTIDANVGWGVDV